jgi:hypothetical protein
MQKPRHRNDDPAPAPYPTLPRGDRRDRAERDIAAEGSAAKVAKGYARLFTYDAARVEI